MANPPVFHMPIMAATKQLPRRWSLCQSWPELDDSRWPQSWPTPRTLLLNPMACGSADFRWKILAATRSEEH